MGQVDGFMKFDREMPKSRDPKERIKDYKEVYTVLDKEKVKDLQRQKIRVIPWTVNEIKDMKRLREWGVDGFITDYPNRANQLGLGIKRK